jgi:XFP C-terminal domain
MHRFRAANDVEVPDRRPKSPPPAVLSEMAELNRGTQLTASSTVTCITCRHLCPWEAKIRGAVAIRREHFFADLKIRFVNVVDLYRLRPDAEHSLGLSDRDFDSLFTEDKPFIFNFHGYPWVIHKFTYRWTNHPNIHVRGYKEKGNINTPLELVIRNQVDRFNSPSTSLTGFRLCSPQVRMSKTGSKVRLPTASPTRTTKDSTSPRFTIENGPISCSSSRAPNNRAVQGARETSVAANNSSRWLQREC